ncbi:MAG: YciK family oxidoreductase [Thiomargarita sp.]|nr:YciK family oxidoreductase [Thiomargarita sp.]
MFDYVPSPGFLKNRVILVTGAGDGIGKAAAKSFASYGATVILLGRTIKKLEAVYDEIEQAGYPQAAIYPMNLEGASPTDYENLANTLETEFKQLDGLLHNAAILGNLTPLEHYNIEMWYKVMQVNLNAPFLLTKACLSLLKTAANASIIFTSSPLGRKGKAYWGAYSVSKFATEGMMQILADELETNTKIRVNAINPGNCRTAMRMAAYPGEDQTKSTLPKNIMPLYLYLIGPDSHKINGQTLNAQG